MRIGTCVAYRTYLSDLAVAREFQRQGRGRELTRRTHEAAGPSTRLIVLAPRPPPRRTTRTSA